MCPAGRVSRPSDLFEREDVERQEYTHDRAVIVEVTEIKDASADRFEARSGSEQRKPAAYVVPK